MRNFRVLDSLPTPQHDAPLWPRQPLVLKPQATSLFQAVLAILDDFSEGGWWWQGTWVAPCVVAARMDDFAVRKPAVGEKASCDRLADAPELTRPNKTRCSAVLPSV